MRILLHGPSAVAWWLSCDNDIAPYPAAHDQILSSCTPMTQSDAYIRALYPHLRQPIHYASDRRHHSKQGRWISHSAAKNYPADSVLQIDSGIFVPRPELALIQSCRILTTHQILKTAGALCGCFRIDPSSASGLASRRPLTTRKLIGSFAKRASGIQGASRVLRLLPYIPENGASPPEVFLALALQGASRFGGFGLPAPTLNERITPSRRAQRIAGRSTLVPDLLWKDHHVTVEFDSDAVHLDKRQIARDASKRLALNADRYQIVTVTTSQLASRTALTAVAREIARLLGIRFRQRSQHFEQENAHLFREGSSLDFLFQPIDN